MKTKLPQLLIFSRLIFGIALIILSLLKIEHYSIIAIILLSLGLLSDIFDGIIARQLNISTEKLRRMDSSVDQVFFISVAIATYIQCPEFFKAKAVPLILIFSLEGLTYLISYLKFKKEVATHSIGAKIWTLFMFASLIQIIWQCDSGVLFTLFLWIGIITRLEIIAILVTLKKWTNDVPSLYHAIQLSKGKEIKRHKMFNG